MGEVLMTIKESIVGVIFTPLDVIEVQNGNVFKGMSVNDVGFNGFGEAYFSTVDKEAIKGWKRHHEMTLNLIVAQGKIRFVIYDDRKGSLSFGATQEYIISTPDHYGRLTIPPMLWVAFQGLDHASSMLLNIANVQHEKNEVDNKNLNEIRYNWELFK